MQVFQRSSIKHLFATRLPEIFLACFTVLFSTFFIIKGLLSHDNLLTIAFDFGIFDQAFWRYSQLLDNFNTVRGLPILGDHFSPIAFIFAPLYWLYPHVVWPITIQSLSVAAGGAILYYIALARLPGWPWIALGLASSYFLHPVVHNTLLWDYHEIVLASGLYMGLIWCYLKDRWWPFVIVVFLLLSCREDMPFTLVAFGCLALIEKRWRYGIGTIMLSTIWWLVVAKWLMPLINGQGYFRHMHGTLALLFANLYNPQFYLERLSDPQSQMYLWQVFFPVGFAAILSPRFLLPALPTLAANVLIGGYNTKIGYHYSVSIMPFLFWGAIESLRCHRHLLSPGKKRTANIRAGILILLCVSLSGWAYFQYSVLHIRQLPDEWNAWLANAPKRNFLARIDKEFEHQGIAATDYLLPHLSHREHIYLFPNPWQNHDWGIDGEKPHHPNIVNAIVIKFDDYWKYQSLLDYLLKTGIFQRDREEHGILLLRRIKNEPYNRDQAIAKLHNHVARNDIPFTEITLSPIFSTTEAEFQRIDVPIARIQEHTRADWITLSAPETPLLNVDLAQDGVSSDSTRYIRAVINIKDNTQATMAIGSDDGVTVWLNGYLVHENIVSRPAHLGDDQIKISLMAGNNIFVFRVNNAAGAWRLLARVRPYQDGAAN